MPHLVRYRTKDGTPADHEVDELGDAIAHVERLRNHEGIDGARIFKVEEVAFEFKPYFRVEIGTAPAAPIAAVPAPAMPPEEPAEPEAAPVWAPAADSPAPAVPEAGTGPAHLAADTPATDAPVTVDPWADAPPPPAEESVGSGSGRRGLFGR